MARALCVSFDEDLALRVFSILENDYLAKKGIFEGVVLPEFRWELPDEPERAARWLFYAAIFMRGGIISEDPIRMIDELYRISPGMFDPRQVVDNWDGDKIRAALIVAHDKVRDSRNGGAAKPKSIGYRHEEHVTSWLANSRFIADKFDGQILRMFDGVTDFEEAFAKVDRYRDGKGLRGMRRKIFSLFTIWLQERELIPVFPTPIPVDFHALRVLWTTGVIDITTAKPFDKGDNGRGYPPSLYGETAIRISEGIMDEIATWSQWFLAMRGLSHLAVNPAIWVLSRDLCSAHFQNSTASDGSLRIKAEELEADPSTWPANYRNPCRFCPLEDYCQGTCPSGVYYRWGILARCRRVPYDRPQQGWLPGIGEEPFAGRRKSVAK